MKFTEHGSTAADYDLLAEASRIAYPDVIVGEHRLNRGTAQVEITSPVEDAEAAATRKRWAHALLPSTLVDDAPVLHLGWPTHGPFVLTPHGTHFDSYLAVAQKVLDENHPNLRRMVDDLMEKGVLLRREIVTDDYLVGDTDGKVKTPADLAAIWIEAMGARWPIEGGYSTFFSSSGAESVEAAIKLCYQAAYKRFVTAHGMDVFRKLQDELGVPTAAHFERDPGLPEHDVYHDYPFHLVACEGAFHGRTLGALSLTWSKKAHRLSYPKPRTVHHVPFNAEGDPVRELVDMRDITEILATPGELKRVVYEQGRIPKDLFAGFVAEPFQGEGGYVPGDPAFFAKVRAVCDETDGLLVVDEVQSVARTGKLFMTEHLGIRPDVVCTAKSMVIGITIARADLAEHCHVGWHSNTWGAGRVFDTNFAWHTLDTLLHYRDPVFDGMSYFDNEVVKGVRLREGLDQLAERHPKLVAGHRGIGVMNAVLVRERSRIVRKGWEMGLKLLGCGWSGEVAPIRILMLADTLTREVDEFLRVFDEVLTAVAE